MVNPSWQALEAEAICRGICDHLGVAYRAAGPTPTPVPAPSRSHAVIVVHADAATADRLLAWANGGASLGPALWPLASASASVECRDAKARIADAAKAAAGALGRH